MAHRWLPKAKWLVFTPLLVALVLAVACGAASTATPGPTAVPATAPVTTATRVPGVTPSPTPPLAVQPKPGGTIPMQYLAAPPHWSVYECAALQCLAVNSPLYNGLIEYNPETDDPTDLRGDLAKSWELGQDGLTYTFRLHENAQWQDGKPVTAADVVSSLESMVDPKQPRPRAGQIKPYYKDSRVIDPYTVEVTTRFPAASFLPFLGVDYMKIMPKHHVETGVNMKLVENQLGSGPFKLVKYERDVSMEYTRNPNYFKPGRPYFDGMKYFIIIDHGAVIASFKAGQVLMQATVTSNLSNSEALQFEKDMKAKGTVHWGGPHGVIGLMINTKAEPFTDVRVRRALYLAVHRQPFIKIFSEGMDTLGSPFPPNFWFSMTQEEVARLPGFRELNGDKHPDDLAEARRLLAEAGFPNGFKTTMTARTVVEFVDVAGVLVDQLKRYLNIDATVRTMESSAGFAAYEAGDWELAAQGEGMLIVDPDAVFAGLYLKDGTRNYSDWTHPKTDQIFELQTSELDQQRRKALVLEATKILLEQDNHWAGLYWTIRSWYVDNRIKNFHVPSTAFIQLKHEHLYCDPKC